jgi:hypothetical protein
VLAPQRRPALFQCQTAASGARPGNRWNNFLPSRVYANSVESADGSALALARGPSYFGATAMHVRIVSGTFEHAR